MKALPFTDYQLESLARTRDAIGTFAARGVFAGGGPASARGRDSDGAVAEAQAQIRKASPWLQA